MRIKKIPCESWSDFKLKIISENFSDLTFKRGKFLFRGQGGITWKLASTFDRWYSDYKGNPAKKSATAEKILDGFIKECELEDIPDNVRNDRLLMLSLGQHNGLPTRLLDWSESPYVAAYFAFSSHIRHLEPDEQHVAVWVLDTNQYIWDEQFGCQIVNVQSFGNERLRNQHGRFTYMRTVDSCLEDYVTKMQGDEYALTQFLIPVQEARAAIADLDSMGLNHARIYPGLQGNARSAEVRVILDQHSNEC
jgi:hypothetical protein